MSPENPQTWLVWIGAALLGVTAVLAAIRVLLGPSILDRVVASDVIVTTVVLALGADMVLRHHTQHIIVMIAIAAAASFATITVARHVRRERASDIGRVDPAQAEQPPEEVGS